MRNFSLALIGLCLCLSSVAQDTTLITPLLRQGCGGDYSQVYNFGLAIGGNVDSVTKQSLKERLGHGLDTPAYKGIAKLLQKYEVHLGNLNMPQHIWWRNQTALGLWGIPLSDYSSGDAGVESDILLKVQQMPAVLAMDSVTDFLTKQVSTTTNDLLSGMLYNLGQTDHNALLQLESDPNIDSSMFITNLKKSPANQQLFAKLDATHQKRVGDFTFASFNADKASGTVKDVPDKKASDNLGQNISVFVVSTDVLQTSVDRIGQSAFNLQTSQTKLTSDVTTFNQTNGLGTSDLQFLSYSQDGSSTGHLQADILTPSSWISLSVDQQKKQSQKSGLIADAKAFTDNARAYVNSTQDVLTIAKNLGIKSPILDDAATAVGIFNTADNAIGKFSQGDILGGIAALTGLFGSHTDPVQTALNQINKNLKTVLDNQKIMMSQLQDIQTGIDTLISGENKIYSAIAELSRDVDSLFDVQSRTLEDIEAYVLQGIQLQEYFGVVQGFDQVNSYVTGYPTKLSVSDGLTPDYYYTTKKILLGVLSQLTDYEKSLQGSFALTLQKKSDLLRSGNMYTLPPVFGMATKVISPKPSDPRSVMITELLRLDSLFYYKISKETPARRVRDYKSLLIPFYNSYDLLQKLRFDTTSTDASIQLGNVVNFLDCDISIPGKVRTVNNYLEPDFLVLSVKTLLNFYYLYSFLNPENKVLPAQSVIQGKSAFAVKQNILLNAQFYLNVAIAQQNMYSGDILIPFMYEVLKKGLVVPPDTARKVIDGVRRLCMRILASNSMVRHNFMEFYIKKRLTDLHHSPANYAMGLHISDPFYLRQLLQIADSVGYRDTTKVQQLRIFLRTDSTDTAHIRQIWSYSLPQAPDRAYPLPCASDDVSKISLDELNGRNMVYTHSLDDLVTMKGLVDRELANIYLSSHIPATIFQPFNQLVLLSSIQ